jgi:Uncharacterized protein conserved in bacteria (DUF2130)
VASPTWGSFTTARISDPGIQYRGSNRALIRDISHDRTNAHLAGEGQQTKMELVYQYLTGPRFRHRIEAVVERFSDMQADLDRERKTMMRLWAKREEQIRGVVESTAGLYGERLSVDLGRERYLIQVNSPGELSALTPCVHGPFQP